MCVTVKFFSLFCVSAYFKTEKPDLDEQRKNRKMKRSVFLTYLQSMFESVVLYGVLGPSRIASGTLQCHFFSVVPEATNKAS